MGVGAEANVPPPELWDGRHYLSSGSAPGANAATHYGHTAGVRVLGGGAGDEGITSTEWASITSAAQASAWAMVQAIHATPAAAWWARTVAAANAVGLLTDMREAHRARYAGWDGVSLASPWVTG